MPRWTAFLVFFAVSLSILGGIHYYFWARLVRDTALAQPWRALATAALVVLAASIPLALVVGRRLGPHARKLALPAYVWLGTMLLLLVTLVSGDLLRGVLSLARSRERVPLDPERRLLLARAVGSAAAASAAGLGVWAIHGARRGALVREVQIPLRRLPAELDGTTIAQLTDLHVGPTLGREFIEHVVERTNRLAPDVVAITGDLVDGSVAVLRDAVAPLAGLRARHGVFFVTGNHEYYVGVGPWLAELERLRIRVLRNERVAIGSSGASFDLAGVDDFSGRAFGDGHGPDFERALGGADPSRELVLLAHQPRAIEEAARRGVGLQLSGHTHGGQIWPFGVLVRLQQPYVAGLHRRHDSYVYVSCGTGYWGPPMRLGAPAEITRVILRRAPAA